MFWLYCITQGEARPAYQRAFAVQRAINGLTEAGGNAAQNATNRG